VRLIYYFAVSAERVFMIDIYTKSEQANLTERQLALA